VTARSLPMIQLPVVATAPRRPRTAIKLPLGACVSLAFAPVLALLVAATWLAAFHTQGSVQQLVLALGIGGVVAGLLAAAWLVRRTTAPIHAALEVARRLSAGDLTGAVDAATDHDAGQLMDALQQLHERLFGVVSQVRTGTTTVAATSSQISRDNDALSLRTDTQVDSLQGTAASMEQLTAAVRQNAHNAQQADALVLAAAEWDPSAQARTASWTSSASSTASPSRPTSWR